MTYTLGIDLGTTYSAAAVHGGGTAEIVSLSHRTAVVPSAVFVAESGELLVGEAALRRGATEPERLCREFKRRIGDSAPLIVGGSPFSAEALTGRLLHWVATSVAEQQGGPPERITLSYPANWGPFKQERMAQAARIAGLSDLVPSDHIGTVTEPEAAAISYASTERVPVGDVIAVYDLGGGTFDAAVLRKTAGGFEVLGTPEGIERLGGIDVDEAVYDHVRRALGDAFDQLDADDAGVTRAVARLRRDCVEAKEALSFDTQVSIPVLLPNVSTEVRLTRGELEAMVRPVLEDSVKALRRAIASADLATSAVDRVLLVGGSSRIPLVAQMVTEALGRPFFVDANPKHVVALGAALSAAAPTAPAPSPEAAAQSPPPTGAPLSPAGVGVPAATGAVPGPPVTEQAVAAAGADAGDTARLPSTDDPAAPIRPDLVEGSAAERGRRVGGGRRRWGVPAAGGVLAVALVTVAFVALRDGGGGGGSGDGVPELSVASTVDVADFPDGVFVDGDDVWVASTFGAAVQRLDEATGEVEETFPLDGEPLGVVVAEGSVWVTQRAADTVARLDPTNGTVQATIDVPDQPEAITAGPDALWVAGGGGTLTRIDPATDTAEVLLEGRGRVSGVAVTPTALWVTLREDDGEVLALDPSSGAVLDTVVVGSGADAVAAAPSGVWVANRNDDTVDRIDPADGSVTASVPVGEEPTGLVADGDDRVWVISRMGGRLELIDPASATIVADIPLGGRPLDVAVSPDTVWVTLSGDSQVVRVGVSPT